MRINRIVEMIKGGDVLLDIGTDHGEVIIEAFKRGYIKKAIATDINEGPLKRAYLNISNAGLLDKVKFIQTDGFNNVNEWYNVVNITGLGHNTIREILEKPHKRPKFYVFGVQSEIEAFRKFLSDSGLKDDLPKSGGDGYSGALAVLYDHTNNKYYTITNKDTSEGINGYGFVIEEIQKEEMVKKLRLNDCLAYNYLKENNFPFDKTGNYATWNFITLLRVLSEMKIVYR
jgi:hypothetical protein